MYNEVECIMVSCDNCKETYRDDDTGFSIFLDKETANEYACNNEWYEVDGNHYCPECHTINDDDELIIDKERTKV